MSERKDLPKDKFFHKAHEQGLALTYGDVKLKTGHSKVMPKDVNIESKFSRNVPLKIPIVSAAMDTVTEHALAIEMAKLGGLGIIHKNMTSKQQAYEVARVKHHLNGMIRKPICVDENNSVESVLNEIRDKGYNFNTFPVTNKRGKLTGILSQNDFDFCEDYSVSVRDIMTKSLMTAKKGTDINKAYKIMMGRKKKVLPLVDKRDKVNGLYIFSDVKRIISGYSPDYNVDNNDQLIVGAAIGVGDYRRLEKLLEENVDVVVIDTAHGDTKSVIRTLRRIKANYNIDVVVGNISEPDSAVRLIDAGADGIKIGQGPGSICTTRVVAGVGCPQVTAIYNCSLNAGDVPTCADGGIKFSGDIPIAIGAGAYSVMMGNMFAGTKEAPGDIVYRDGRQWKVYRGMGSLGAMKKNKGSRQRYYQEESNVDELVPEGIEGLSPYKGQLSKVITQYVGGLRAGMGYVGAENIEELREKADFNMITAAGKEESHPHEVLITKESPNYRTN